MELDGTIIGKFGKAGKQLGEFSTVHEMDCRNPNEMIVARKSPRGARRRSSCKRAGAAATIGGAVGRRLMRRTHCHVHCSRRRSRVLAARRCRRSSPFPRFAFDARPTPLKLPDNIYLGEVAGVATNSKGDIFVYTRTGQSDRDARHSRAVRARRLAAVPVRSNGQVRPRDRPGIYGFLFAHRCASIRRTTSGSSTRGRTWSSSSIRTAASLMMLGRKPEAINVVPAAGATGERLARPAAAAGGREARGGGRGGGAPAAPPAAGRAPASPGDNFNRPTDVAWDAQGNIYVADGYGNSRIAKFDKNGKFIKTWGIARHRRQVSSTSPHAIAIDAQGNVYVADAATTASRCSTATATSRRSSCNVGTPSADLHHAGPAAVSSMLELEPVDVDGQRRDLQDGAGREDRRQVRRRPASC